MEINWAPELRAFIFSIYNHLTVLMISFCVCRAMKTILLLVLFWKLLSSGSLRRPKQEYMQPIPHKWNDISPLVTQLFGKLTCLEHSWETGTNNKGLWRAKIDTAVCVPWRAWLIYSLGATESNPVGTTTVGQRRRYNCSSAVVRREEAAMLRHLAERVGLRVKIWVLFPFNYINLKSLFPSRQGVNKKSHLFYVEWVFS